MKYGNHSRTPSAKKRSSPAKGAWAVDKAKTKTGKRGRRQR